MERSLQKISLAFAFIQLIALVLVTTGAALPVAGQVGAGETVIQKATEQFDNSPLQTISLGNGLFLFSGDGGNVTAVVDNGSTLLIDSGMESRAVELNDAVFKATMRPRPRASSHSCRPARLSRHAGAGSAAHQGVDYGRKDHE